MSLESGTYIITNDAVGNAVDLLDGNTAPGTPIIGYERNKTAAQKVRIFPLPDLLDVQSG